ncbi:hypothetical protein HZS_5540 [Henneguya salminicola]|nr:hypothetical protein HZS_5540 [Henneguya salminicola]
MEWYFCDTTESDLKYVACVASVIDTDKAKNKDPRYIARFKTSAFYDFRKHVANMTNCNGP